MYIYMYIYIYIMSICNYQLANFSAFCLFFSIYYFHSYFQEPVSGEYQMYQFILQRFIYELDK